MAFKKFLLLVLAGMCTIAAQDKLHAWKHALTVNVTQPFKEEIPLVAPKHVERQDEVKPLANLFIIPSAEQSWEKHTSTISEALSFDSIATSTHLSALLALRRFHNALRSSASYFWAGPGIDTYAYANTMHNTIRQVQQRVSSEPSFLNDSLGVLTQSHNAVFNHCVRQCLVGQHINAQEELVLRSMVNDSKAYEFIEYLRRSSSNIKKSWEFDPQKAQLCIEACTLQMLIHNYVVASLSLQGLATTEGLHKLYEMLVNATEWTFTNVMQDVNEEYTSIAALSARLQQLYGALAHDLYNRLTSLHNTLRNDQPLKPMLRDILQRLSDYQ